MPRRVGPMLACLPVFACLVVGASRTRPDDAEARAFTERMLREVGAVQTDCAPEILEQVRARRMQAVCASFDGTFEWFELRLDLHLEATGSLGGPPVHGRPRAEPETEWESSGPSHDRIYRVGGTALGVRFLAGQVLVVW